MIGAINIFGKKKLIFSFVGLVTWGWVHIQRGVREKKCQKMNVNIFTNKLG